MSENEIDFKRLAQYIGTDSETGLESCNFCLRIFNGKHPSTRRRSLMNHIDSVHLKTISHKCQFCDKSFLLKTRLTTHMRLKHPEEKRAPSRGSLISEKFPLLCYPLDSRNLKEPKC